MKDERLYLLHIQDAIQRIENYTVGGKELFLTSTLVQDAVLRNLQTMSESSHRLSEQLKSQYPEIPWRQLWAFRNVVAHDYLGISLEHIWDVLQNDLPTLKKNIEKIICHLT